MSESVIPGIRRVVQVDGAGVPLTPAQFSKAEDAAHVSGDAGIPAMVVRKDTAASLPGTDGDYSMLLVDASGRLHINDTALVAALGNTAKAKKGEYETVAASQTGQVLGATGAAGDYLRKVIIVPETTAPGVVTLIDDAVSIALWLGGTVGADLKPIVVELDMVSAAGAWSITTGANVHVIAVGDFT